MKLLRRIFVVGIIATGALTGPSVSANTLLSLETDTPRATAGYYQLRWEAGAAGIRLVEATNPAFADKRTIYQGPDTARLISGKPDGDYFYRLESGGATPVVASETLHVTVEHHSMTRAFTFFAIGAAVFVATLGLILFGGSDERR